MKTHFILLTICALAACQDQAQPEQVQKPVDLASVTSAVLDEPPASDGGNPISIQGIVDVPPNQHVSIQPFFQGYATDIQVIEGSKVKKGALLFRLKNPEFVMIQRDYLTYKAQVKYLSQDLERKQTLNTEQITADQVLQETQMKYDIARANLETSRKMLSLMNLDPESIRPDQLFDAINIFAPISGHVDELSILSGEFVGKNREVASIINTSHIHLELRIFEKDLTRVQEGQQITFRIPELNHRTYQAVIYLIGKSIDPETRMVHVHAHLIDEELELIPGMFVEAVIESAAME